MKAPDMVRSFDLLYKMAATGGSADALFGTDEELLRQANFFLTLSLQACEIKGYAFIQTNWNLLN